MTLSYDDPNEEEEYNQVRLPILKEFFNVKSLFESYSSNFFNLVFYTCIDSCPNPLHNSFLDKRYRANELFCIWANPLHCDSTHYQIQGIHFAILPYFDYNFVADGKTNNNATCNSARSFLDGIWVGYSRSARWLSYY